VKRFLRRPVLVIGLIAAALLASFAPTPSSRICAQSLFPNTRPIYYNPYGQPFAPGVGLTFQPLPFVYSQPLLGPSPSVYSGFGSAPYGYGNNYGYGSSPYVEWHQNSRRPSAGND
jgi:hypothetical protein